LNGRGGKKRLASHEEGKNPGQPGQFQSVFDVIHRSPGYHSIGHNLFELLAKDGLHQFGSHTHDGSQPHPENRSRSTHGYGRAYAGDVSVSYHSGQRGHQGLERRYVSLSFSLTFAKIFGAQQETKGESKAPDLDEPESDGQEKSHTEEQNECLGPPNDRGQEANDSLKNIHLFFAFFLPSYFCYDIFMEGKKIVTQQTGDDQRKPGGIALDERVEGITEKTDKQEEVEECE